MKNKSIFIFFSVLLSVCASATTLKEGIHYEVINKHASKTPTVTEFFSFYCSHCYAHEPLAKKLKKNADKGMYIFEKNHVNFIQGASKDAQFRLAKAIVAAELLNKPKIIDDIFNAIHNQKQRLNENKDLQMIFKKNGISEKEFNQVMTNFGVTSQAIKMQSEQDALEKSGYLNGVPTFIINDKYKILPKGFNVKTYGEYFDALEDAAKQLSERKD